MINYEQESEKYRPTKIKTLLVGEAPPQSGDAYFFVPRRVTYNSLPGTVFIHYFNKLPKNKSEYITMLKELQNMGIWFTDIINEPLQVWLDRRTFCYSETN